MIDPVITVDELRALGSGVALADVRWYLGEPERGLEEYRAGHIPGAVYVDLDRDLSYADGPGRHPLPNRSSFARRMGELGFGNDDLVVAYDDRGGAIAARLWWMLRDIGHTAVRVLDGGLPAWRRAGHAVDSGSTTLETAVLTVRPSGTRRVGREGLQDRLGEVVLLDARAGERYRGEEEPIDPVAGHIPTAVSADMTANLAPDERFLDSHGLSDRFEALGVNQDQDTVVYCGSGVTACHNALAMVRAGLPEPILYPGSWSDWSSSGGEVAVGSEPGQV